MPEPTKADVVFAEIVVKNRLLKKAQVDECLAALREEKNGAKSLADVIEKRSLLSSRAIASITRARTYRDARLDGKLYGRIAVKSKFADVKDVKIALDKQKKAYVGGQAVPDVGAILLEKGAVTPEEDRAIRDAMAKLDRESVLGRKSKDGGDEDEEDLVMPDAAGEGPAKGKAKGEKPLAVDTQAVALDEVADAAAERKGKASGKAAKTSGRAAKGGKTSGRAAAAKKPAVTDSSSSISESSSGRNEPAPSETLLSDIGAAEAPESEKKPARNEDTNDLMDVVIAQSDLAPLREGAEGAGPKKESGEKGAAKPKRESGEKATPPGGAPAGDSLSGPALLRAVTPPGGLPRLEVEALKSHDCPRCNVRIEPGVDECLYCGYKVEKPSRRASAAAPEAAKGEKAAPAGEKPAPAERPAPTEQSAPAKGGDLSAELDDVKVLASGCRGDLVRAKDRKRGGAACIAVALPAGVTPAADQLATFEGEAKKADALGLRAVLKLERVGKSGGRTVLVYEDAPRTASAVAKAQAAPFDRMRAAKATREVAAALAEVQKAGLVAREVRADMVLVAEEGDALPVMAGLFAARLTEPPAEGGLTEGFDGYVPPERQKKADRADVRADIHGVGALLKVLLSGKAPTGKEPKEDMPEVPGALKVCLSKTLDAATGKRFLDAGKLVEELEKAPGVKGTSIALKR